MPPDTKSEDDKYEAEYSLLQAVPPRPGIDYEEVMALERAAKEDPENIRVLLRTAIVSIVMNSRHGCMRAGSG